MNDNGLQTLRDALASATFSLPKQLIVKTFQDGIDGIVRGQDNFNVKPDGIYPMLLDPKTNQLAESAPVIALIKRADGSRVLQYVPNTIGDPYGYKGMVDKEVDANIDDTHALIFAFQEYLDGHYTMWKISSAAEEVYVVPNSAASQVASNASSASSASSVASQATSASSQASSVASQG